MKSNQLSADERNAVIWLERQPGVTSVVTRRGGAKHSQPKGTTKITASDAKSVNVRFFRTGHGFIDLFVHAPSGIARDTWVKMILNGHGQMPADKMTSVLTHEVKTAASFSAQVPSPKPIDETAGQIFDVTPDLAAKWLERNTRNRALRSPVVMRYASDMKEGRWKVTGDAIAFDKNGSVVNGQHRLWAVLESGVTVPMLVVFDLDPDVVYVLDDHFKRTITDVLHIGRPGSVIQTKHTACVRRMMVNLTAVDRYGTMNRISRQKQIEFLDRHMDAIMFATSDCFRNASRAWVTNANILAAVARAYYTQDRERLKQFGRIMLDGVPESHADDMAIVFRNWVMNLDKMNVRAKATTIYAKAERALMLFIERKPKQMLFEATEELFPLPEETAPARKKPSK